jgi:hypothetical protein
MGAAEMEPGLGQCRCRGAAALDEALSLLSSRLARNLRLVCAVVSAYVQAADYPAETLCGPNTETSNQAEASLDGWRSIVPRRSRRALPTNTVIHGWSG